MKSLRYKAVVDNVVVWESNSIKRCKEKADFELNFGKGYFAKIIVGRKEYATRFYDTEWIRH